MGKYKMPEGSLISFFSNKVKQDGGINFAQGIPGYKPPKELLEILHNVIDTDIHQYAPGKGNGLLLDLLTEHYKEHYSAKKNDFLILQGATEAISLVFTYLHNKIGKKYSVLAIDPVYESYNNLPKIFNNNFIAFHLNNDGTIDFELLRRAIIINNVKIIFISSPGNPYGKVFTKDEQEKILQLAKKINVYVIFDAVYKDLYYHKKPFIPLKNLDENLFYVNSFSKMLSITGWRVGYLIAHKKHMSNIQKIHDYIGLCAPSLLQEAIAQYLDKYNYAENYLKEIRKKLNTSYKLMSEALVKFGFRILDTDGGYFIWAELPQKFADGFDFAIELYEKEKVAVIPGIHFSEKGKKYIRFNIAREEQEIKKGIQGIKRFVGKV